MTLAKMILILMIKARQVILIRRMEQAVETSVTLMTMEKVASPASWLTMMVER